MLGKRGVSPLIAIVLLLAFAVALATIIGQLNLFGKCELAGLQVLKYQDTQRICYNQKTQEIEIFLENKDKRDIVGFRVTVTGKNKPLNIEHLDVPIHRNEQEKLVFKYDRNIYGDILGLSIYPKINKSSSIEECEISDEIQEIPYCE
jgi:flagellin-like protein